MRSTSNPRAATSVATTISILPVFNALTVRSRYLPENASTLFLWATAYDTLNQKKDAAAYYRRFLDAAAGKFPDQEWQARQRLKLLER